jgi:hypothetical protein
MTNSPTCGACLPPQSASLGMASGRAVPAPPATTAGTTRAVTPGARSALWLPSTHQWMEWGTYGHHKVSAAIPAAAARIGEGLTQRVGEGLKPAVHCMQLLNVRLADALGAVGTPVLHRLCRMSGMLVPIAEPDCASASCALATSDSLPCSNCCCCCCCCRPQLLPTP